MITILQRLRETSARQHGASLVEYALLIALIALIAVPSLDSLGYNMSTKLTDGRRGLEGTQTAGAGEGP